MKNKWSKWMLIAALMVSVVGLDESKAQGVVSLQVFYNELQPYGTWMHHANYGYVWIPRVDRGFVPYGTNGYWINTEYGNTWVSDYSWGWAPFHYGRWFYDDFHGWLWVPDTVWGPAWVAWRSGGGYYGWAPLMPGFGINVSYNYYGRIPSYYWNFVPYRYITYRQVYNHCVPRTRVVNVIHNTTIITHNHTDNRKRSYFTGPSRSDIEKRTHQNVEVHRINDRNRPGRSDVDQGTVSFYKPEIDNSREANSRAVPSRFMEDERNRSRVESRREVPSEVKENRQPENSRSFPGNNQSSNRNDKINPPNDFKNFERSQQLDQEKQNRSFQNFKNENEQIKGDKPEINQRMPKPVERQNDNPPVRNYQRQHEQFSKPAPTVSGNNSQRSAERQPQRTQPVERQSSAQHNRSNSQPERSSFKPADTNRTSTSQPQREQQIRRNSDNHSNPPPTRSVGEKKPSPSRGR